MDMTCLKSLKSPLLDGGTENYFTLNKGMANRKIQTKKKKKKKYIWFEIAEFKK